MSRIYSTFNKIRFTSISESYKIKPIYKSTLNNVYSSFIMYVKGTYDGTAKYKRQATKVVNILTYAAYTSTTLPYNWNMSIPFVNIPDIPDDELEESLGDIYLTPDAIEWDLDVVSATVSEMPTVDTSNIVANKELPPAPTTLLMGNPTPTSYKPSQLSDVSIKPPEIPQFDVSKVWKQKMCGADLLAIYTTLPEIPKVQRDISITTDINKMTDQDLLNLYPNRRLQTRASIMYVPQDGLPYDETLGVIIPIDGYTLDQCKENIIKYPHFYKLARYDASWPDNNGFRGFYSFMEIDGKLVDTLEVWNSLEISKKIPTTTEYIKEYVVRKYLLDRDIGHKEFKYPLFGTLDPFLTLFMPVSDYQNYGYDPIETARACVNSRVSFKQSRSPILRRMLNE